MKKIVCELCEGTQFIKENGMFVCQGCGTRYSAEEARSMMIEVEGDAEVGGTVQAANITTIKDDAKINNLMSLAKSSFESKNYAQAEEFCNQIIAIDANSYEAWKLKGEAINYQIGAKNQRILEVYNCIMTSYRVLPEDEKENKRYEIISSLKTCFEGEVEFWLNQFEAGRPTDEALTRAKNAYTDAYNKMKSAFEEMKLEDAKEKYLINFDNFFIVKCSAICISAWKTTVGYNYYRDYMNKGIDPFGRKDHRWVIADTDLYRPSKHIWETFVDESDNLVNLLQFAEEQFNDDTNPKIMETLYNNIAFIEKCVIPSGSWKITQGYTSGWDQYQSVGWHEEYTLNDKAKKIRQGIVDKYEEKERNLPEVVAKRKKDKEEKERKERIDAYWAEHREEKEKLEAEKKELEEKKSKISAEIAELNAQIIACQPAEKLPSENEFDALTAQIDELQARLSNLGLFAGKEKKQLAQEIASLSEKRNNLQGQVESERAARQQAVDQKAAPFLQKKGELQSQLVASINRINAITAEFEKDPEES